MKNFDVLVIGSGMAGMTIAQKCGKKGLKTAITDFRPYGGTCALRGCDPKKILIGAAEIIDRANKMKGNGIVGNCQIHWKDLMKFKNDFVSKVPDNLEKGYKKAAVEMIHGKAQFESDNTIRIEDEIIRADKIAITTGARAVTLNIPGGEIPIDSTKFLDLNSLPRNITFIGGGYTAFAKAFGASRFEARDYPAWDIYMFYSKEIKWEEDIPLPNDYTHQLGRRYTHWADYKHFNAGMDLYEELIDLAERY